MANLLIDSLECKTTIGVHEWEKAILQKVVLSCSIAAQIDGEKLNPKQDYGQLCRAIREYLLTKRTELLETLATDLVQFINNFTDNKVIQLKITKPGAVANCQGISIELFANAK